MTYTFDDYSFSDLHKDAYGFRPGESFWIWFETATDNEKQSCWDHMIDVLERNEAEQKVREAISIQRFESRVVEIIDTGAGDRTTAIRWIVDGIRDELGDYADAGYACYILGLPYSYEKELEGVV